jgi:hypothetical protein
MWTKALWDHIPWDQIQAGEREGWTFFDDFTNMPALSVDADLHKYAAYIDTGATILQGADSEYGELVLTVDADDNQEASIQTGGNTGGLAKFILQATAVPHTIAFEARVKVSTIVGSAFVGFAEEGCAATDGLLSDTGTIPDKDCLGFFLPEADPDGWDFVYNKSGGADPTTKIADIHTAVAGAYVKFGCLYRYQNAASKQIKVFKNGVVNATYVTKANIDDATNFPGGEEMALYAVVKNVTDIKNMTMDWWRAALVVNA